MVLTGLQVTFAFETPPAEDGAKRRPQAVRRRSRRLDLTEVDSAAVAADGRLLGAVDYRISRCADVPYTGSPLSFRDGSMAIGGGPVPGSLK
jgi:hypothetical protein